MRVISGKYRGRRLKGPKGTELRPTGDRLKETLFNILKPQISGAVVLDVFSGTGAIGIEALSRGADRTVFIERDPSANALIRQNLEICGIEDGFSIIRQDAFKALRSLARQEFRVDIIYFDPPYDWEPYPDLLKLAFKLEPASRHACVVIEHRRNAVLPETGKEYRRYRLVRQGDKCLSFYQKNV